MLLILNSSKVLYTWEFVLKGEYHKIEFWDSRVSGKKKLSVDENVIVENNNSCAVFNYSFQLDSYYFNLVQLKDDDYDIRINNNYFQDIIKYEQSGELEKSKKQRKQREDDKVFDCQTINNTIKLDDDNNNDFQDKYEENRKILNDIDFFSNDKIKNEPNNPLSFTFKNNNNSALKVTGNFYKNSQVSYDNNNIEENNINNNNNSTDYPSFSEL